MPGKEKGLGRLPLVAILGRPNVGKSTLMNRIAQRMAAIVDPTPGVTRDRKYAHARWRDREFLIADTGGVGVDKDGWLSKDVERQAFFAADEADVVIMLADATTGVTEDDIWLARKIKKMKARSVLAVNKVDNPVMESEIYAFYSLGLGDPTPVSAYHGRGVGELLDVVIELLPEVATEQGEPEISIAIVGRPNVGKSSVLNWLAKEERAIVHEEPHTTRDTVDTVVEINGATFRILDTAGLRKKKSSMDSVEFYSSVRTYRAIDEADVVLLVVDGFEGPGDQDQKIASKIDERGRAAVLIINKWDLVHNSGDPNEVMESISQKFRFAPHLPLLRVSALTGKGMDRIIPIVREVYQQWKMRIPTPSLNSFLLTLRETGKVHSGRGKKLKIYYATQVRSAPPTIVIFVNDPELVNEHYKRFLANRLRENYGFWGSPLRLVFRESGARKK